VRLPDLDLAQASVHNTPWFATYSRNGGARASWSQHGLPAAFERFVSRVRNAGLPGWHVDMGCGNGAKTHAFARAGLPTIGVDVAFDGLQAARSRGPAAAFVQANGLRMPFGDQTCASASDILCFTHIPTSRQSQYLAELHRVLRSGGRALLVLFSTSDEHFHGHPVSTEYAFRFDPANPRMAGYEHYEGMLNVHFDRTAILRTVSEWFTIEDVEEVPHPVYAHRKLWEVVVRKASSLTAAKDVSLGWL
jgi:ubiquinone/menaquinone biosynthesis C-methylase UbiE